MRATVIQMNSRTDKAANLAEARRLCSEAVKADKPDLVVFPEMMAFLGGSVKDRQASAERIPGGETFETLRALAVEHGIAVHGGSFYESTEDSELIYNTTVAFDPSGNLIAKYRKIHLFDITAPDGVEYKESAVVGRGSEISTFDLGGVRVGCSICYDIRFGELYRMLAERGADAIVVPAAFTLQTGKDHWETLLRARAIETQTYIVAAGQWGSYPTPDGMRSNWGHSMIVDPWGHVVAQVSDTTGFASAFIDSEYISKVRSSVPVHRHRVLKG
ncbi:MAG: carbon-nitrogen hydrolase family protein [Albidovulum sp.]|nr:carbon-nitrogen hydrolase family protein [Albidovulum sp.]